MMKHRNKNDGQSMQKDDETSMKNQPKIHGNSLKHRSTFKLKLTPNLSKSTKDRSWRLLGSQVRFWAHVGRLLERFGGFLEAKMGYLEASWSVLEACWRHLGAVLEGLGGIM